jgi:hypothetical protein
MAVGMRQRMRELTETWRKSMHQLDFGVGIAQGYATVGMIGFEGRVADRSSSVSASSRGLKSWYTPNLWGNSRSRDSVNLYRYSTW